MPGHAPDPPEFVTAAACPRAVLEQPTLPLPATVACREPRREGGSVPVRKGRLQQVTQVNTVGNKGCSQSSIATTLYTAVFSKTAMSPTCGLPAGSERAQEVHGVCASGRRAPFSNASNSASFSDNSRFAMVRGGGASLVDTQATAVRSCTMHRGGCKTAAHDEAPAGRGPSALTPTEALGFSRVLIDSCNAWGKGKRGHSQRAMAEFPGNSTLVPSHLDLLAQRSDSGAGGHSFTLLHGC